jgi:hypothetical protein
MVTRVVERTEFLTYVENTVKKSENKLRETWIDLVTDLAEDLKRELNIAVGGEVS